jgi:hypothetical protein
VRLTIAGTVFLASVLIHASSAFADATLFIGTSPTPTNRQVRGGSVGISLIVVGFEFEYASTNDDLLAAAPSLKTGSGNGFIQTPIEIFHVQPYATGGFGFFREELGLHQETGFASNTGGGVKISLAGPLRLRVDYRVFKLSGGALYSPAHRIYAGLNLKF